MNPMVLLGGQFAVVFLGVLMAWIVATRRLPAPWSTIGWGALAFPLSQVARMALVLPVSFLLTSVLGPDIGPARTVLMVLTSGLFEETARWIALRYWAKRARSWEHGVAFGLGHGGIEALLIMGMAAVNGIIVLSTADAVRGTVAAQAPEQLQQFEAQVQALESLTIGMAGAGVYERVIAIITHVTLSLIVLRGVRTGRWQWWALAVVLHCLANALAVGTQILTSGDVVAVEGALTVVAAVFLWALLRGPLSRRSYDAPAGPARAR